jgi:acyl-CoA synthetase (AMP-forming)/AMP-acid ligase II
MVRETLRGCFRQTAERFGAKRAITFIRNGVVETAMSYLDLDRDANRLAHAFLKEGLTKGDRIVFFIEKSLFLVVAHLAAQKIGAIGVPLNPGFKKSELTYLLDDAEARLALTAPEQAPFLNEIDPHLKTIAVDPRRPYGEARFFDSFPDEAPRIDVQPEDPALIIYTSGTTGNPKGAVLTQRNLVHDARNVVKIWEISDRDAICHALPLFHIHGLCFALHSALMAGAHVVMLDRFIPEAVTRVLSDKEGENVCTVFMAVPSMYAKLMAYIGNKKPDFGHMRLWTSGSAPLLAKGFREDQGDIRPGTRGTGRDDRDGHELLQPAPWKTKGRLHRHPAAPVGGSNRGSRHFSGCGPRTDRRDLAQRAWCDARVLAQAWGDRQEFRGRLVQDRRSGGSGRGWLLLSHRPHQTYHHLGGENISPKEVEAVINRYAIPFKSPFRKGGFRGISIGCTKIPPNPPLRKGGIGVQMISVT